MSDARTCLHGVPCWVDTEQPDPQATRGFYAQLFGWTFEDAAPPGAPTSYWIASLDGDDVAAIAPAGERWPGARTWPSTTQMRVIRDPQGAELTLSQFTPPTG